MDIHWLGLTFIVQFGLGFEIVLQQEVVQWDTAHVKCSNSHSIMLPGRRYKEAEVLKQMSTDQKIWLNGYRLVLADNVEDSTNKVKTLRVDFTKPGTETLFLCEKEGKYSNASRKQDKPSERDACQSGGAFLATVKSESDIHNIFDILEADKQYRLKNISLQGGLFKQCQLGTKDKNAMTVTFADCTEAHSFICFTGDELLPLITLRMAKKDEVGKPNIALPVTTLESSTISSKFLIHSSYAVWPSEYAFTTPVVETSSEAAVFSFELTSSETEISSSDALSSSEFALSSSETEIFLSDAMLSADFELFPSDTEISSSVAVSSLELTSFVTKNASKDAEWSLGFTSTSPKIEISSAEDIKESQETPTGEMLSEANLKNYQTLSTVSISDHAQSAVHTNDTTEMIQQTSSQEAELTLQSNDILHVFLQTSYFIQPSIHTGDLTQSSFLIGESTQSSIQTDILPEPSLQYIDDRLLQQEILETTSHDSITSYELLETDVTNASLELVQATMPFKIVESIASKTPIASEFTNDGDINESKPFLDRPLTETETYFGTEDITKSNLMLLHDLYPSSIVTVSLADETISSKLTLIVDGTNSVSPDNSLNIGIDYEKSELPEIYSEKIPKTVEYTSTFSSLYFMPLSSVLSISSNLVASPKTATDANYDADKDDEDTNLKDKMVLMASTPMQHQTESHVINHTIDEIVHTTDDIRHTPDDITVVTDTKSETELPTSSVAFSSKYLFDKVRTTSIKHIYVTESNEIEDDNATPSISGLDEKSEKEWVNKDNDVYIVSSTQYPKYHLDEDVDTNVAETSLHGKKQNTSEGMETALWIAFAVIVMAITVSLIIALVLYRRRRTQQKSIEITELATSTNGEAAELRDKQSASPSQTDKTQPQGETATFQDAAYEI